MYHIKEYEPIKDDEIPLIVSKSVGVRRGGRIVFLEVYDAAAKNGSNRSDSGFLKFTPHPVAPSLLRRTCMSMCAHTRGNEYHKFSIYFMIQK